MSESHTHAVFRIALIPQSYSTSSAKAESSGGALAVRGSSGPPLKEPDTEAEAPQNEPSLAARLDSPILSRASSQVGGTSSKQQRNDSRSPAAAESTSSSGKADTRNDRSRSLLERTRPGSDDARQRRSPAQKGSPAPNGHQSPQSRDGRPDNQVRIHALLTTSTRV